MEPDILVYKKNVYSQFGEDGIIKFIFDTIGPGSKRCCEFGAWDGIHFSNCRNLVLSGWEGVMIEGDRGRYEELCRNYENNPAVRPVNRFVDRGNNTLDSILGELHIESLDFLSIDIDGLDYQIMESLRIRPRVICVEVNAGHDPENEEFVPPEIAKDNIGQPLASFCWLADRMGYTLVCYNGNAFFVRKDISEQFSLPSLSPAGAYMNFLRHLPASDKEWLYLVNLGLVTPYFHFHNSRLKKAVLGIGWMRSLALQVRARGKLIVRKGKSETIIGAST